MKNEVINNALAKMGKNKYIIAALAVGIILMLIPGGKSDNEKTQHQSQTAPEFSLEEEEEKLEKLLGEIDGVGQVKVMLSLKSSTEQVLAYDEDISENADIKTETVIISNGSGTQAGIALKYIYPEYQGAAVVAQGADKSSVRLAIVEAVSSVTGLSSDEISVTKMKG